MNLGVEQDELTMAPNIRHQDIQRQNHELSSKGISCADAAGTRLEDRHIDDRSPS
jgi:hypothetical protein